MASLKRLLAVLLGLVAFGPSMLAQDHPPNGNALTRVSPTDTSLGPIQFDTRGVEFGPWIRGFVVQVKRNWLIPDAARSNKGHVIVTFNVKRDGEITDVKVAEPSAIEPFNDAAFGAITRSSPTVPLPDEYPDSQAKFTVTFSYNEDSPDQKAKSR